MNDETRTYQKKLLQTEKQNFLTGKQRVLLEIALTTYSNINNNADVDRLVSLLTTPTAIVTLME